MRVGGLFGVGHIAHDVNLGLVRLLSIRCFRSCRLLFKVMSRTAFAKLRNATKQFCLFDDYNWDLTLERLRASGHVR